jgi:hypothetical protein
MYYFWNVVVCGCEFYQHPEGFKVADQVRLSLGETECNRVVLAKRIEFTASGQDDEKLNRSNSREIPTSRETSDAHAPLY